MKHFRYFQTHASMGNISPRKASPVWWRAPVERYREAQRKLFANLQLAAPAEWEEDRRGSGVDRCGGEGEGEGSWRGGRVRVGPIGSAELGGTGM
jgi:hypothetical protein